ncbi:MAG: hypothetical protein AAB666_01730 [Patescibacteria group bacterium]
MLIQPVDILKKSWQIFKVNWQEFTKVTAWLVVLAILSALLSYFDKATFLMFVNYTFPIYVAISALVFVVGLWVNIVLARMIWSALHQLPLERRKLAHDSWRDTVSYLWVSILVGVIVTIGTVLFIVPGVIFGIWYSFAALVFVLEGVKGYEALKKSKSLVQGRFWLVVWRWAVPFFVYSLILVVIIGLPTLLVGVLTQWDSFKEFTANNQPWWFQLIQSVTTVLTLPLSAGFGVVLYNSLKENAK